MKRHPINQSLLVPILCFWVSALISAWIPGAEADQDLGFELVGTGATDDSRNFAIIEIQSTGNQGAYREGERLGEVVIKKIMSGEVVIGTKTGDQMLSMRYRGRSEGDVQSPPETAPLNRKAVDCTPPDYMRLMYEIRVRPYFEAGQPAGFIIYSIEPGSIFARMGLENGDVIVGVHGKSITITQQARELYDALKKGRTVNLEIKRGETKQELHFVIQ